MKERNNRDIFGRARREACLDLIHATDGMASNADLEQAARIAQQKVIEKVGNGSEKRFVYYALHSGMVKSVRIPDSIEGALGDVYDKIDGWVTLNPEFGLPELPYQVKSSRRDAKLFKEGDPNTKIKPDSGFTRLHGLMIVINSGPSVKQAGFRRQLEEEIQRIKPILKAHPSYANFRNLK